MRPTRRTATQARDVPLGPDAKLRVEVVANPQGTELELRIYRASPADRSAERWHPTGDGVRVSIAAYQPLMEALKHVGAAASEVEFWRPMNGPGKDAA